MNSNLSVENIKKLYYKEGLSSSEIASKEQLSVWQVLTFMRKHGLPRRTATENNESRFLKQRLSYSLKRTLTKRDEKLKLAALMLYWAEGVKGKNQVTVDFVNSDYKMILVFLKFLRRVCGVEEQKLRVLLYCYSDQDTGALVTYWSRITDIPENQFQEPYIRKDFNPNGRKMGNGLVHVRYNDKKLFNQIMKWLEETMDL